MQSTTRTLAPSDGDTALPIQPNGFKKSRRLLLHSTTADWEDSVLLALQRLSLPALRLTLGFVFVWFGALKVFGVSPIAPMLRATYPFMVLPVFTTLLGAWEILIGLGLVFKLALRQALCLMCLHLAGTFVALWLAPSYFFLNANPLVLTVNGEFVVKNLVLLTAGLVIASNESSSSRKRILPAHREPNQRSDEGVKEQKSTEA